MTTTETAIDIAAPAATIYALASATERWPQILPHYRYVRVLEERGATRVVAMGAWRHCFPLAWVAEQTNDPHEPRIVFRHVAGPASGMDVAWTFAPTAHGTRVRIEHRLAFRFPFAAEWLGEHVVGDYFIAGVAARTLARMKALAERAAA